MSEKRENDSESPLRGSLVTKTTEGSEPSLLRGTLIGGQVRRPEDISEPRLAPDDYELPDTVADMVARRGSAKDLVPFDDPTGMVVPGRVFASSDDPTHRRLITNVYTAPRGNIIAAVHIEGEPVLRNLSLTDVQGRIEEGAIVPLAPEK